MKALLLWLSAAALVDGLALAWAHFQGAPAREPFLNGFIACSAVYFLCATLWAYRKEG